MHDTTGLTVLATDAIGTALAGRLTRLLGRDVSHGQLSNYQSLPVGSIVITTAVDCPVELCAEMVRWGLRVIVLTARPQPTVVSLFTRAGASAVVPLDFDSSVLLDAIGQAVGAAPLGTV